MRARVTISIRKRARAREVSQSSPEDVRAAVLAARVAAVDWAARPAASRGRVLYRLAEVMESRLDELRAALAVAGATRVRAAAEAAAAIDRTIYYAGFCDKLEPLLASRDPVPGPLIAVTSVEPMGVVVIVAPARPALLGLVSTVLPAIAAGNACIVLGEEGDARTMVASSVVWRECVAASGLPPGAIEVLAGSTVEIVSILANHPDIGTIHDPTASHANVMRSGASQGLACIARFVRSKTLWHPAGV